jgi:signal-transduction protein with cAMP-binding, CBS, and nucleotidyltransferase domain
MYICIYVYMYICIYVYMYRYDKEKGAQLMKVSLFASLTEEERAILGAVCIRKKYAAGKTICKEGTSANKFFIITSGVCTVSVKKSKSPNNKSSSNRRRGRVSIIQALTASASSLSAAAALQEGTVVATLKEVHLKHFT